MEKEIIGIGLEISQKLWDEPRTRDVVGGSKTVEFEWDSKKYNLTIDAFWEKSNYFDYKLEGVGFKFQKTVLVASEF